MKTKRTDSDNDKSFPKLMTNLVGDEILLVHHRYDKMLVGVMVDGYRIGEYSDIWAMQCFKDYNGKLELSND